MLEATSRTVQHEFSRYLDLAHEGEQIVITKHGKPWATLTPMKVAEPRKVVWPDVAARAAALTGGREIPAVKTVLSLRDEERW